MSIGETVQRHRNVSYTAAAMLMLVLFLVLAAWGAGIKPVLLWTDMLIFLLLAMALLFAAYTSQHEHLRAPWVQVRRSRLGMVSVVILSVYIIIGLADTLHFHPAAESGAGEEQRYAGEVVSVLDILLRPISSRVERTYSAPFATHSFTKETIENADGTQVRDYPPLEYGGAHLAAEGLSRAADITATVLLALVLALAIWALHAYVLILALAGKHQTRLQAQAMAIVRGATEVPWREILLTVFVVLFVLLLSIQLGTKYHILGTDKVGQDVFYQAIKSIRTGLVIGTLTTLIMLPFAVLFGIMAGYFRGWVDDVIQYVYTTLNSIPGILLIAAAVLLLQVYMDRNADAFTNTLERNDLKLLFLCMILGITSWTGLCRMLRGESLKLREMDYISAATAMGVRHMTIISRHILPNVMHIVLIAIVLDFSGLVLAEAVLSYVGVGVDPTTMSWGNMINTARLEMAREPMVWWSLLAAFTFMFTLVLAANLFSDVVRDAFDPRLRQQR